MRLLTRFDVQRALPMRDAIPVVKKAFAQLSTGRAKVPLRVQLPVEKHDSTTLVMSGYLSESDALAVKIVSVSNQNVTRNLPLIHALVVVVDSDSGRVLAAIEGSSLTALRTGAASGAATELLARTDARIGAIFGAGVQARTQLLAVCAARALKRVWIYDTDSGRLQRFINENQGQVGPGVELMPALSPTQAVSQADVICTATTSKTPVFNGADIQAGVHINGIGSFTPSMQEIDLETLRRATKIVVDAREAARAEAGDLIAAMQAGVIRETNIYAELGEIAAGLKAGRETAEEITFFKSVGNAAQDVAVARAIYEAAVKLELGVEVEL